MPCVSSGSSGSEGGSPKEVKWRWMWRRLPREESEERMEASDRVAKVSTGGREQGALLLSLLLPLLLLLLLT